MAQSRVRWVGIAIDCSEVEPMARFYEQLLGFTVTELGPRWAQLHDPAGGVHLNLQAEQGYEPPTWPEQPEAQQKMLHLEIEVDDLEDAVANAIAAGGAEATWQPPDRDQARLRVMVDPAGHPFCLFLHGE